MENFKFKLEKVLDIKIKDEEEYKIIHSKIQNEKKIVEDELNSLQDCYDKYSSLQEMEDINKRKIVSNYLNSLFYSIQDTTKELEIKNEVYLNSKKELINKQVERKSLEKLKEKKFEIYKKEQAVKEQNQNDEYSLQSYLRFKAENMEVNS